MMQIFINSVSGLIAVGLLFMKTKPGPLLKLLVASLNVAYVRECIGVRIDMLLQILALREISSAKVANISF